MAIELSEQEQLRRQSLTALRNLGIEPYPAARYEVTATAREIADNYDDAKKNFQDVRIAGRIMSRRIMGSASFFELQDHTGRIQVYIRRDDICPEGDPTLYNTVFKKLLDIGDFIGVEGFAFHTNTGELSVHCRKFTVLSKSIRPLPVVKEKDGKTFDAFTDPEVRYRQRYLDLIVNPQVKETFVRRARIMATMREFFNERGYIEVETPILQPIPGGASARPFITHHNSLDIDLYLRIATELYLKKLIVGGFDGVYEFGKNFRNEGMDRTHNPEFTVMEIYVAYKDYLWMMEFTEQMLERVAMAVNGTTELTIDGKPISFKAPFRRLTMTDAIREKTGYDITGRSEEELREACKQLNVEVDETFGKGKLIDAIFGQYCEEELIQPTFITDYPREMSPLCKRHRSNPDLTERFELFVNGKELCNAYSELNDPIDQLERFQEQLRLSEKGDDVHRHGLRARTGIRHADLLGNGHRHRPADDVYDRPVLDPGRAVLPADAPREEGRERSRRGLHRHRRSRRVGSGDSEDGVPHRRVAPQTRPRQVLQRPVRIQQEEQARTESPLDRRGERLVRRKLKMKN